MLELARVAAVLAAPCELFPSRACLWQSSWARSRVVPPCQKWSTLVRVASAVLRSCVVVRVTRCLPVLTCARQLLSRLPGRDLPPRLAVVATPPSPSLPPSQRRRPSALVHAVVSACQFGAWWSVGTVDPVTRTLIDWSPWLVDPFSVRAQQQAHRRRARGRHARTEAGWALLIIILTSSRRGSLVASQTRTSPV